MKKLFCKIFKITTFLSISFLSVSCIENNIKPPFTGQLNSTAEMLVYFESLGDFPNSGLAPALVSAEEVYTNLANYLILDVRSYDEFLSGHIEGALYIQNDSLYNFLENLDRGLYPKIIITSTNGHRSAYFTCLLRLAGFNNIYSLNFGMASWNLVFADKWLSGVQNISARNSFSNDFNTKGTFTNLPEIVYEFPDAPIQKRVANRIESIIKAGFTISKEYRSVFSLFSDELLVCYGKSRLYNSPISALVDPGRGHADGTIHYADSPFFELRAVQYLQTLPANRAILIYDYNGQLSACMVAYLRALGYDAISLEFGANYLFYDRMLSDPELSAYAFDQTDIKNFPYVTGN